VLGVGVQIEDKERKQHSLSSPFDLISAGSFDSLKVRRGVWKQPFSNFLPLVIDSHHWGKARRRACKEVANLAGVSQLSIDAILKVVPKLMNSMVVKLMKGDLHISIKALEGYCGFHHLFLQLCMEIDGLREEIDRRIDNFVHREDARRKDVVPNLGEFLAYLSVSDKWHWGSVCEPYLFECFDRHVLWQLKAFPALSFIDKDSGLVDKTRMSKCFQANVVSLRLVLFNIWFLQHVAKAPHSHSDDVCANASCAMVKYSLTKGLPGASLCLRLQAACRRIYGLSSWADFFHEAQVHQPSDAYLCRWLRRCVLNSLRKGYHRPGQFERIATVPRSKPVARPRMHTKVGEWPRLLRPHTKRKRYCQRPVWIACSQEPDF
jgi:hypothetical protein